VTVQKALIALADALDSHGQMPDWQGWLNLVADMASVLPFSHACNGRHDPVEDPHWMALPWRADRQGDWLRYYYYYCPTHRATWSCGYSVRILERSA
jgi:hypothetical protein